MLLVTSMLHCQQGMAQDMLDSKQTENLAQSIASGYDKWTTASWEGKVRSDILPFTPTMKVFMEHDKLTLISLRVPLLGELGRIEIDCDSILIINKYKKTYWSHSIKDLQAKFPDLLSSSQSLMLGRAVIIGHGELSKKNAKYVRGFGMEDGFSMILPDIPESLSNIIYGYSFNQYGEMVNMILGRQAIKPCEQVPEDEVIVEEEESPVLVNIDIDYNKNRDANAIISVSKTDPFATPDYILSATLSASKINWAAKPFDRIRPGKNYVRVNSIKKL